MIVTVNVTSPKVLVQKIRAEVDAVKNNGTAAIYCDNLLKYLDDILSADGPGGPDPVEMEKLRADFQILVDQQKYNHESNLEMFRSTIMYGQQSIKSSFILNGGAAVAMLAFVGHLAEVDPSKVSSFAFYITQFAVGAFFSTLTFGFSYLSQWYYGRDERTGYVLNILSILFGICSMGVFICALVNTQHGFLLFDQK